jgi:iodotyrosine deiodinase
MKPRNEIPLNYPPKEITEMKTSSEDFASLMQRRRTVRTFSEKEFPKEIIYNCIKAALSSPSGANQQPWHFVIISNTEIKKQIRIAAEKEEHEFYNSRAPKEWLEALIPLGTDYSKPFLETAPYLIAIFEKKYEPNDLGKKKKYYYTKESVGIACGILITALHNAGIATLTHTPSPMNFLNKILERPQNEKPFLLLVAGFPALNTTVPNIRKKNFNEVVTEFE